MDLLNKAADAVTTKADEIEKKLLNKNKEQAREQVIAADNKEPAPKGAVVTDKSL